MASYSEMASDMRARDFLGRWAPIDDMPEPSAAGFRFHLAHRRAAEARVKELEDWMREGRRLFKSLGGHP